MKKKFSAVITVICFLLSFVTLGYFYWGIIKAMAPLLVAIIFILTGLMSWGNTISLNEKSKKK